MPYNTVEGLPPAVKKLPGNKQRQFMHVWNSAYASCQSKGGSNCEEHAFAQAWGVIKKEYLGEGLSFDCKIPEDGNLVEMDAFVDELIQKVEALPKPEKKEEKEEKEEKKEKCMKSLEISLQKLDAPRGLFYGIVYSPFEVDTQGDFATPEEIEKAAHDFLPEAVMNLHHKDDLEDVQVVESYIAPMDFEINGSAIKKGSWILVSRVLNEELKKAIEAGEITAYSLEGTATHIEHGV